MSEGNESGSISGHPTAAQDVPTLFGQTTTYVAITVGFFALGAYLGRNLTYGWGWVTFLSAFACLFAMRFAVRQWASLAAGLLFVFGVLMGLAVAPTLAYDANVDSTALWQAGGATALFMIGLGAASYGSRRDLSGIAHACFWGLVALILFGIMATFVHIPNAVLIYSIAGLVIFAGLTLLDFQRLRSKGDASSAPLIAASIFLDALNVFLFFLNTFSRSE